MSLISICAADYSAVKIAMLLSLVQYRGSSSQGAIVHHFRRADRYPKKKLEFTTKVGHSCINAAISVPCAPQG